MGQSKCGSQRSRSWLKVIDISITNAIAIDKHIGEVMWQSIKQIFPNRENIFL
jgi:hypothetical protein